MRVAGGIIGLVLGILYAFLSAYFFGAMPGGPPGTALASLLGPLAPLLAPVFALLQTVAIVLAAPLAAAIVIWLVFTLLMTWVMYAIGNAIYVASPAFTASSVIPSAAPLSPPAGEQFFLGLLIGMAAGINAVFWILAGQLPKTSFTPPYVAWNFILALTALIPFLTVFAAIATSRVYQTFVGWFGVLMPYTWLATAVGLLLFLITFPIALGQSGSTALRFDFTTATIEVSINLSAISGFSGGFSLGNFTFLMPGPGMQSAFNVPGLSTHETGHTLNSAVFGGAFLWINAIDENLPGRIGPNSWGELLAESHFPRANSPYSPLWTV